LVFSRFTAVIVIVHPPEAGEMIRRLHTAETGTRITRFSQRDLERGAICYRHFGHEMFIIVIGKLVSTVFMPSLILRSIWSLVVSLPSWMYTTDFLCKSSTEKYGDCLVFTSILPIIPRDDTPPYVVNNMGLEINKGGTKQFGTNMLKAHDIDTVDRNIIFLSVYCNSAFVIYAMSFSRTCISRVADAGRIIATHNMSMVAKDESLKEVRTFKQEDINHMKIAYMPPLTDIGVASTTSMRSIDFVSMSVAESCSVDIARIPPSSTRSFDAMNNGALSFTGWTSMSKYCFKYRLPKSIWSMTVN
jgi:hypothetical protein